MNMEQKMNTIKSTLNDKEPETASGIELDPEALERIAGGVELSAAVKEKIFKIVRNAIDQGCTKEEFLERRYTKVRDRREREFVNNVWEIAAIADIDVNRKRRSRCE